MIMVRDCAYVVSQVLEVPMKDIYGTRRDAYYMEARLLTYWAAKQYTLLSYPRIGKALKKDHTSIMHGFKKIDKLIKEGHERTIHYSKKIRAALDDKFGNVDLYLMQECVEAELMDLQPALIKKLYEINKQIQEQRRQQGKKYDETY